MDHPRIVSDPNVMGGKPCIKGTRVPVYIVLNYLAAGDTIDELLQGYPTLAREDVHAALAYAADVLSPDDAVPA